MAWKFRRNNGGRKQGSFRIPVFNIFYSLTYTALYVLCLLILAITPVSMLWAAIQNEAYQYVFMIGGSYVLTALLAIITYSSRIYTNKSTLAGVGKAYVPIEKGEVGNMVRRMIVKQLERSAIVAWESRPRNVDAECLLTGQSGTALPGNTNVGDKDGTVGLIVPVNPRNPPWGDVQHDGWSSPNCDQDNEWPEVRFSDIIAELPNLIEARAVSLAPPEPEADIDPNEPVAPDALTVELLRRPANVGLRSYLTQLSYLNLIQPPTVGEQFLSQYECARFSGRPVSKAQFSKLMSAFSDLLSGMTELEPAIVEQIHLQTAEKRQSNNFDAIDLPMPDEKDVPMSHLDSSNPDFSDPISKSRSVTLNNTPRANTPRLPAAIESTESFGSVIRNSPGDEGADSTQVRRQPSLESSSLSSLASDAGSVLRHEPEDVDR